MAPPTPPIRDTRSEPRSGEEALARYRSAVARTDALIERSNTPEGKTPAEIRARAELRLRRVRRFLAWLGNPQDAYHIVHVGGTSGKGSTSVAIAAMLSAGGYKAGLHTSPYLQVATEKLQIDGRLIHPEHFADLVDEVLDTQDAWLRAHPEEDRLTYGEVWVALLATYFRREQVDLAVIEVGAGGRFDLTNVVQPVAAVVTSVGLDHTVTLGGTIPEIAWHKAGIIKAGASAVTAVADPVAFAVIATEAERVGTPLGRVVEGESFEVVEAGPEGTTWRELRVNAAGRRIAGPLLPAPPGRFQATNAAIAVATVRELAARGFPVTEDAIRAGLASARLPGRFERVPDVVPVVLDGAHNPEKVAALAANLPDLGGAEQDRRLTVVLGALEAKQHEEMIQALCPHASELVTTSASVLAKKGATAAALAQTARSVGFVGRLTVEPEPMAALTHALERTRLGGGAVLVTGSLYLVGTLRRRWYPDEAVVLERTPWPRQGVAPHHPGQRDDVVVTDRGET